MPRGAEVGVLSRVRSRVRSARFDSKNIPNYKCFDLDCGISDRVGCSLRRCAGKGGNQEPQERQRTRPPSRVAPSLRGFRAYTAI